MKHLDFNKFDLSSESKITSNMGYLYPIYLEPTLPGDKWRIRAEVFLRLLPLIAPMLHRVNVRTFWFYVRNRIIWEEAEEFYTRGRDNTSTLVIPSIRIDNTYKSQWDQDYVGYYLGVPDPTGYTVSGNHDINELPLRAHLEIYNNYFRDQEYEDEISYGKTTGTTTGTDADYAKLTALRKINKEKDYFTNAKKQAVLNEAVNGFIMVNSTFDGTFGDVSPDDDDQTYEVNSTAVTSSGNSPASGNIQITAGTNYVRDSAGTTIRIMNLDLDSTDSEGLYIDVDDIRRVSALQRFVEDLARLGYRYKDYIRAIWNVKSSDRLLDLPEYIGGSTEPVRISEVANTSSTATEDQGNLAGRGISQGSSGFMSVDCEEHGWIIGLMAIVPKNGYSNRGMDRFWNMLDHTDYPNPYTVELGMQDVKKGELYYDYTSSSGAVNEETWAYQNRDANWKTKVNKAYGEFDGIGTLDHWHMNTDFSSLPANDENFRKVEDHTDQFATSSGHHYLAEIYCEVSVLRKLPYYANPKID